MSTEIFIHGCNCGITANYIARVRSKAQGVIIYNSKRDKVALDAHIAYLKQAGMDLGSYQNIVVEDAGRTITLLKEWK